jgi:hypothetical protein
MTKETPMPDAATTPMLDHDLAEDELAWMQAVYKDFSKVRAAFSNPKDALQDVLRRDEYRLAADADISGPGPWRLGRNRHGRGVAAVFLPRVELHRHANSRTDQFAMYVLGEADAFPSARTENPC